MPLSSSVGTGLRLALISCLWAALILAAPGVASEAYPMRWRVFRDYDSGTAFRFPYEMRIPDMYRGVLQRGGGGGGGGITIQLPAGGQPTPEQIAALVQAARAQADERADLRHRSIALEQLPAGSEASLAGVAALWLETTDLRLSEFDYYADPERRPHAAPRWAPEGISAVIASAADRSALVLRHGERFSGLVAATPADDAQTRAIFDTFEVMVGERGRPPLRTWREHATVRRQMVFDAQGREVSARSQAGPVSWAEAWDCETPNYHITSTVSPGRLLYYAGLMEALHQAYSEVYQPETLPPYKMEVHIVDTVHDFVRKCAAIGVGPVQDGSGGSLTGGFFIPDHLATVTFDKPVPRYPIRVEQVLAHEASHQFLHVTCNGSRHVPTWINEGLAVYFESGEYRNGRFVWRPPVQRLAIIRQHYARTQRTLQPLEDYLDHYGHIPAAQYGEVYAMTHFWIFGSPQGRERFVRYWQALKEGENGTEAFERIFLADMITAAGGRAAAMQRWSEALRRYVIQGHADRARPVGR